MSAIVLNNQEVSIVSDLRSNTGGVLTFKKYAELKGVDLKDKPARKAAMVAYDQSKKTLLQLNRKALGLAVADAAFDVKKFNLRIKDGDVVGWDAAGRVPSKAEVKASQTAAEASKDAQIAAMEKELAALKAAVAAVGITPEEIAQVPALES